MVCFDDVETSKSYAESVGHSARDAAKNSSRSSRKLGFRCDVFSETELPVLRITPVLQEYATGGNVSIRLGDCRYSRVRLTPPACSQTFQQIPLLRVRR